jgi:hypothetical protein
MASVATPQDPVDPSDPSDPGIPQISSKTGWVVESNGNVHRASLATCNPMIDMPACVGDEKYLDCKTDADCKEHPHGRCVTGLGQVGRYCGCHYSCASDSDCGPEEACVCKEVGRLGVPHSVCARAACRVDADCESKQCGLSTYNNGCSTSVSLACRTKDDACKSDGDCGPAGQCAVVRPGTNASWQCGRRSCVIGRPLVIDGEVHAAQMKNRDDWQGQVHFSAENLKPEERRLAANHYATVAAMEHASVASFARFSLQLMALGAPADLVRDAHQAALDEIEHAQLTFALANLFGKTSVGPDKLPAAIANIDSNIDAFVKALVLEGCVGETLGAAEGNEAAQRAGWSEIAQPLAKIARDEERHATLAWRSLQWALATFGEQARNAAVTAFAEAMSMYSANPSGIESVESVGVFSGYELGALRRHVLTNVITPCARALGIVIQSPDDSAMSVC